MGKCYFCGNTVVDDGRWGKLFNFGAYKITKRILTCAEHAHKADDYQYSESPKESYTK